MSFADCLGGVGFGFCVYSTLLTVINLKLLLESRFWNLPLVASVILSIVFYLIFNLIMAYIWVKTGLHNAAQRMTYVKESTYIQAGIKFNTSQIHSFPPNMDLHR